METTENSIFILESDSNPLAKINCLFCVSVSEGRRQLGVLGVSFEVSQTCLPAFWVFFYLDLCSWDKLYGWHMYTWHTYGLLYEAERVCPGPSVHRQLDNLCGIDENRRQALLSHQWQWSFRLQQVRCLHHISSFGQWGRWVSPVEKAQVWFTVASVHVACDDNHQTVRSHVRCLHCHHVFCTCSLSSWISHTLSLLCMCVWVSNVRTAFLPHCCQVWCPWALPGRSQPVGSGFWSH